MVEPCIPSCARTAGFPRGGSQPSLATRRVQDASPPAMARRALPGQSRANCDHVVNTATTCLACAQIESIAGCHIAPNLQLRPSSHARGRLHPTLRSGKLRGERIDSRRQGWGGEASLRAPAEFQGRNGAGRRRRRISAAIRITGANGSAATPWHSCFSTTWSQEARTSPSISMVSRNLPPALDLSRAHLEVVRRLFIPGYYCGFSNMKMSLDIAVVLADDRARPRPVPSFISRDDSRAERSGLLERCWSGSVPTSPAPWLGRKIRHKT